MYNMQCKILNMYFCGFIFVLYEQMVSHTIAVLPLDFLFDNESWKCFLPGTHSVLSFVRVLSILVFGFLFSFF